MEDGCFNCKGSAWEGSEQFNDYIIMSGKRVLVGMLCKKCIDEYLKDENPQFKVRKL